MGEMEDARETNWVVLILSGLFFVLVGIDLINDHLGGSSGSHLVLEGLLLGASGTLFILSIKSLILARRELKTLRVDLENLRHKKERGCPR